MRIRWLCLLWLLSVCTAQADSPQRWEIAKNEDGITIHTRHHQDGLVEIRAQMFEQTSYAAFLALLEDSANLPNWIDNVSSSRVLKQLSPNENIVYTRFSAPWPARNRDMVTYSRFEQPNGAFILTIEDASNRYPPQPDYIRIKGVKATWTLEKLTNGLTHIDYIAFADPGGNLPDWMANKLSVSSAFNTFQGLRQQLPKYQQRQHSQVSE
ncbi:MULTISPECIES: START domain-containing protein [Vibrio]|uniref:START domain-containing protein n=1 Tax=Vibrio ostreae TaxID=2841925 RepID=A0A975U862_9VIBR|nr:MULTISPECIES: START domain-containing protein [Vibrio]QXO15644.1 START domain-containing protein [Vibrio ostreae]